MRDWFVHIATLIVLIAGVALVVYELRQTKSVAKAQLAAEGYAFMSNQQIALFGENPLKVLAKECRGEKLNEEEALTLMFYFAELNARHERMKASALILDEVTPWLDVAEYNYRLIFSVPAGHAWWENWKHLMDEDFYEVGERVRQAEIMTCSDMIEGML